MGMTCSIVRVSGNELEAFIKEPELLEEKIFSDEAMEAIDKLEVFEAMIQFSETILSNS